MIDRGSKTRIYSSSCAVVESCCQGTGVFTSENTCACWWGSSWGEVGAGPGGSRGAITSAGVTTRSPSIHRGSGHLLRSHMAKEGDEPNAAALLAWFRAGSSGSHSLNMCL